jgi:FAD/FMN-containing dehydrogenase
MEFINDGSSGPLEHGFGEARDLVLGMQVVLGSGELIRCGGKVVKNVTGYDLPKLFAGAQGTLCIPFSAHLRLYALPERALTSIFTFQSRQEAFSAARKLCQSGLPISCLELFGGEIFKFAALDLGTALPQLSGEQSALALQIHGISSVVDELAREIKDLIGGTALGITIEPAIEQKLWNFLASPQSSTDWNWIQVAAPNKVLEQLLQDFSDKGNLAWTARPGRQKALLLVPDVEGAALINSAAQKLKTLNQKATVASKDNQYSYKVQNLPSEDAVLGELKHRLKRELDPHGVLNPLAQL